ncbi:MAG TPA: NAD-dependent epimerase/dehydratase family protein, partial [Gemmatimonadaceae bacterium]
YGHARGLERAAGALAGAELAAGEIGDAGAVLRAIDGADAVIHLAHSTVPGSSMADPAGDVEANVAANVRWLARLREASPGLLLFVSSGGTVYGPARRSPLAEDHPTEPISPYGISKLALEKYVAMFAGMAGARHLVARPANVYGPGQRLDAGQGVVGVSVSRALRGEPIEIWGTGEVRRDYLYVRDAARALVALLDYDGPDTVFNVGSGEGRSVLDIVAALGEVLPAPPEVRFTPGRTIDVPDNVLDASRLRRATGWAPEVSFGEGLAATVAWARGEGG